MRKILSLFVILSYLSVIAIAKDNPVVPKDQKGDTADVSYAGVTCTFKVTTSANQSYTTAGTATPGYLYGVVLASGAATDYYVITDTGAINTTNASLLSIGASSTAQFIDLSKCPIKFTQGLSVKEVKGSASVGTGVALLYRLKSDN